MAGDIVIRLIGDARDLERKFEGLGTKLDKVGDKLSSVGKKLTLGLTLPLIATGVAAFKAASDLSEAMNKVDVVFGRSSASVKRFSSTAARSLGISRTEALQATGTFGNLFTAMGLGESVSARMSTSLVKLASDLASFNNVDPSEALDALRSGLVGETEPLKRFGVNINEATLRAKALELGLIKNTKAQNDNAKSAERVADAQRGLADALRNASERAEDAAKRVREAEQGVADARQNAAERAEDASQRVIEADEAEADAKVAAARRARDALRAVEDADEAVTDAEERLADAQRDAKTAQEALTDARKAAERQLEDLSLRVEENAVRLERARLRVTDAEKKLAEARKSGDARQILDAELDLKDAQLNLTETTRDAQRDQEELNRRRQAGIEGSDEYRAAQERLADANENVLNAQEDLGDAEERAADAREEQSRVDLDNARSIADAHERAREAREDEQKSAAQSARAIAEAEERLTEARKEQTRSAEDSARSIADAQRAIAEAQESVSSSLAKTSDEMTPAIKAQAAYALIMEQTKKAQGDFARTADGAANKQRILVAELKDQATVIGAHLLPVGLKLLGFFGKLLDWVSRLSPANQELLVHLAAIAAAAGPIVLGIGKMISAFSLVGQAAGFLFANPIVLAIAAVVAAVALIIIHWDKVKAFLLATWDIIKRAASVVFDFLKNIFLNFTPIGLIIGNWDTIRNALGSAWNWLQGAASNIFGFLKNLFLDFTPVGQIIQQWDRVVGFFKWSWETIKNGFRWVWENIPYGFKTAINNIIGAWNRLDFGIHIGVPSWVPGIGGWRFDVDDIFPDIPYLAKGGIVTRPTLAMLGEAGDEAVIPLDRARSAGRVIHYHMTFNVPPNLHPSDLGQIVVEAIREYERRSGAGWRAA